ncbi:hypothetical protein B484DRAFT_454182 [Ochromonadaceae sp. CCMP2298]|nr:hypothetical protein B484DRAFT_454182 [Ochromonadaceae sp. CCMP2298]
MFVRCRLPVRGTPKIPPPPPPPPPSWSEPRSEPRSHVYCRQVARVSASPRPQPSAAACPSRPSAASASPSCCLFSASSASNILRMATVTCLRAESSRAARSSRPDMTAARGFSTKAELSAMPAREAEVPAEEAEAEPEAGEEAKESKPNCSPRSSLSASVHSNPSKRLRGDSTPSSSAFNMSLWIWITTRPVSCSLSRRARRLHNTRSSSSGAWASPPSSSAPSSPTRRTTSASAAARLEALPSSADSARACSPVWCALCSSRSSCAPRFCSSSAAPSSGASTCAKLTTLPSAAAQLADREGAGAGEMGEERCGRDG